MEGVGWPVVGRKPEEKWDIGYGSLACPLSLKHSSNQKPNNQLTYQTPQWTNYRIDILGTSQRTQCTSAVPSIATAGGESLSESPSGLPAASASALRRRSLRDDGGGIMSAFPPSALLAPLTSTLQAVTNSSAVSAVAQPLVQVLGTRTGWGQRGR